MLEGMMFGYPYENYFTATTSQKLSIIFNVEDHVLGLDNRKGKVRFLIAVTALSPQCDRGEKLYEMLTTSIDKYQNKVLTAAEVIDELIKLAKTIHDSDSLAEKLNLASYEYAFYSAVADNDSARELMQKEKLRELSVMLTDAIRSNVSLDWTVKESARAKIRVIVKRLLKNMAIHRICRYWQPKLYYSKRKS